MDLRELTEGPFERHPWERARCRFFGRLLRDHLPPRAVAALDVGAGDAWLASELARVLPAGSAITCWDEGYTDEVVARLRPRVGPVELTPARPAARYSLLLLLDVLEHVEDDQEFLATLIADNLDPGAHVLVSVPAWSALYGAHDERLLHHRRYDPKAIEAMLRRHGLEIAHRGGLFHSLVAVRAVQKLGSLLVRPAPATEPPSLFWRGGALARTVVDAALKVDATVSRAAYRRGVSFPGLSWWALCRRA